MGEKKEKENANQQVLSAQRKKKEKVASTRSANVCGDNKASFNVVVGINYRI